MGEEIEAGSICNNYETSKFTESASERTTESLHSKHKVMHRKF